MTKARSNATANAAKGDLTVGNGTNLSGVLGVGNNGETIVADSSTSTGLRWQADFAAGKNKIINGDFSIWQRGTSFSNPSSGTFLADRFRIRYDGTGATRTLSQQTFTPGTAPSSGYEGQYFFRFAQTVAGTGGSYQSFEQAVEDVRTLAGQTATFSFWAKAASNQSVSFGLEQNFGSGGSGIVYGIGNQAVSVTTSWQRFALTISVPSVSGKTIGTGSYLNVTMQPAANLIQTIDTWGWKIEAGSVATAFQTATGTIQGELAACQRYYQRFNDAATSSTSYANGQASSTTAAYFILNLLTTMRVKPTTLDVNLIRATDYNTGFTPSGSFSIYSGGTSPEKVALTASTFTGLTQFRAYVLESAGSTAAYIGIGAEL